MKHAVNIISFEEAMSLTRRDRGHNVKGKILDPSVDWARFASADEFVLQSLYKELNNVVHG